MALAKRLHDAVERKKSEQLPLLDTVASVHAHIDAFTDDGKCEPAWVEMCVVSIVPFKRGWRYVLTDKDAAQGDFATIQQDFDSLTDRETSEFIFRLTLWRGKKHPRRQPTYKPGTILFAKRVTDLETYHDVCQGTTDMDDMIKQEDEEAIHASKKTKKTK